MTTLMTTCRLSGEPLADAEILFEISKCPLPGIYPATAAESMSLHSPLRVVQARRSGLVQLAHIADKKLYQQYAFAGGGSVAYRNHLNAFANDVAQTFPKSATILEVGCGDGWLLRRLREMGFTNVLGIDPSRAARGQSEEFLIAGYFPDNLPASHRNQRFDLIISRHVLEHIENPRPFVAALAGSLASDGQLWIEVPDLDSTLARNLWSNFYQLHCNYFSAATLDQLLTTAGLRCLAGTVVEVFGGSLLRKYVCGAVSALRAPDQLGNLRERVTAFQTQLNRLATEVPKGTVGYGAAERTAVTLGFAPELIQVLSCLHDGNPLLANRYLAGTPLKIHGKETLFSTPPPAILMFAISNAVEILNEWHCHLPGNTLVGMVGGSFQLAPLKAFK